MRATYEEYLDALSRGDTHGALGAIERASDAGATRQELLRDVIARAQDAVGSRWLSGEWGVADEHAATSVAEQVLALAAPPEPTSGGDRLVLLSCAEGEWHTFPPRLAAALAREPGLQVLTLGGSISARHLSAYLERSQPAAVALSVTLEANLVGAARSIRAACEAGVPVVVGGAAWGGGQHRARVLGASCFLEDPTQLAAVVAGLSGPRAIEDLPDIDLEVGLMERLPPDVTQEVLRRLHVASAWVRQRDHEQEQRLLEDVDWMGRHAAAGVLCEDSTVVASVLDWLLALREPRGVPAAVVLDCALVLSDVVEDVAPRAAAMLRAAAAGASAPG